MSLFVKEIALFNDIKTYVMEIKVDLCHVWGVDKKKMVIFVNLKITDQYQGKLHLSDSKIARAVDMDTVFYISYKKGRKRLVLTF